MIDFLRWLLRVLSFGLLGKSPTTAKEGPPARPSEPSVQPVAEPEPLPSAKGIVTLLIFPTVTDDLEFNKSTEVDEDTYYLSSPWELSSDKVNEEIKAGDGDEAVP